MTEWHEAFTPLLVVLVSGIVVPWIKSINTRLNAICERLSNLEGQTSAYHRGLS